MGKVVVVFSGRFLPPNPRVQTSETPVPGVTEPWSRHTIHEHWEVSWIQRRAFGDEAEVCVEVEKLAGVDGVFFDCVFWWGKSLLAGGLKYLLFSHLLGEDFQFD